MAAAGAGEWLRALAGLAGAGALLVALSAWWMRTLASSLETAEARASTPGADVDLVLGPLRALHRGPLAAMAAPLLFGLNSFNQFGFDRDAAWLYVAAAVPGPPRGGGQEPCRAGGHRSPDGRGGCGARGGHGRLRVPAGGAPRLSGRPRGHGGGRQRRPVAARAGHAGVADAALHARR
jgi:hypothetical protein